MQNASLKKAELACRCLELEAKESAERDARAEAERDAVLHEASMAKLLAKGALSTRAQVETELAQVQRALGLAEEARRKAEFYRGAAQEVLAATGEACKKVEKEKLALVIELGAVKDDFASFRETAAAEKEILEATFDSSGDTLFNYGYGCCAFRYNICGSKPKIPEGMPNPSVPLTVDFFANPRCPPSTSVAASALDPVVVNEGDRSVNSPPSVELEIVLSSETEGGALVADLPAE